MNCFRENKKMKNEIANVECCVNYLNINSFKELLIQIVLLDLIKSTIKQVHLHVKNLQG